MQARNDNSGKHSPFFTLAQTAMRWVGGWGKYTGGSNRESVMNDIAVLNDVVFAFETKLARFLALRFAS